MNERPTEADRVRELEAALEDANNRITEMAGDLTDAQNEAAAADERVYFMKMDAEERSPWEELLEVLELHMRGQAPMSRVYDVAGLARHAWAWE